MMGEQDPDQTRVRPDRRRFAIRVYAALAVLIIVAACLMILGCSAFVTRSTEGEIVGALNSHDDIFTSEEVEAFRKIDPEYEKQLRDGAFKAAMDKDGYYVCPGCGMRSKYRVDFQVDHIVPMNKGGKTVPENLQILCRPCNARKSDHV